MLRKKGIRAIVFAQTDRSDLLLVPVPGPRLHHPRLRVWASDTASAYPALLGERRRRLAGLWAFCRRARRIRADAPLIRGFVPRRDRREQAGQTGDHRYVRHQPKPPLRVLPHVLHRAVPGEPQPGAHHRHPASRAGHPPTDPLGRDLPLRSLRRGLRRLPEACPTISVNPKARLKTIHRTGPQALIVSGDMRAGNVFQLPVRTLGAELIPSVSGPPGNPGGILGQRSSSIAPESRLRISGAAVRPF